MADKVKAGLGILSIIIFVLVFNLLDEVAAFIFAGVVIVACIIALVIQHTRNKPPSPPQKSA